MLAIRLRRAGKTHFAAYRIVVQEAQKQPTSGKVVAFLGAYNPHTKEVSLDAEIAQKYLNNGAQPTPRVAKILRDNGVKLPSWVAEFKNDGAKKTRNPEKLRKNQVKETPEVSAEKVEESAAEKTENSENSAE